VVQVDFPRLNILLDGQLRDQALGDTAPPLVEEDIQTGKINLHHRFSRRARLAGEINPAEAGLLL
jgi:hypothetical protein